MSLWKMSIAGAVMIACIVTIRALAINRLPKKTFLALWGIALIRLLVPYSLPSALSVYSLLNGWTGASLTTAPTITVTAATPANPVTILPVPTTNAAPVTVSRTIDPWTVVWAVGALICAVFFAVTYWKCRRKFRESMPVENEFVKIWISSHRLRRTIEIRQSDRIAAPLTYGVFRPVILLPKHTDWTDSDSLQYVLMHEYVHIRRFDAVMKLSLTAAACIHWFNPAVWLMYVLANRDIELSCDEAVVRLFGERTKSAYALTLIRMEETKSELSPLYNHFSKNAIEERIVAIMKTKKKSWAAVLAALVLIIGVTAAFATTGQTASAEDTAASADPSASSLSDNPENIYQSVDVQGQTVLLRAGPDADTMELILADSGTVLLTLRQGEDYYNGELTIATFADILGTDGVLLRNTWDGTPFRQTFYYALTGASLQPIGESFGFGDEDDTAVDLDGDGITELITNNTWGGDGHPSVYVYRNSGGEIQQGFINLDALSMPGFNNWGVNATSEYFDAENQVFQVLYSVENQEEPSLVTFSDLSPFTFSSWLDGMVPPEGSLSDNPEKTTTELTTIISYVDRYDGKTYYSTDNGQTWLEGNAFKATGYDPNEIEWWTAEEYEQWIEEQKQEYQSIIGERSWNPTEGWYTWDQARVDEAVAGMEQLLEEIKDGKMVSKPTQDGDTMIQFSYDPRGLETATETGEAYSTADSAVWFAPEDIHDIESAELVWWNGTVYPALDSQIDKLTEILTDVKDVSGTEVGTGCPFHSVLYLHRSDGTVGKLLPAEDGCEVFLSDGKYYMFGDGYADLYKIFGVSIDDLPVYSDNAVQSVTRTSLASGDADQELSPERLAEYEAFGLTCDKSILYYNSELVRYFNDSVDIDGNSATAYQYWNGEGTVDIHTVRQVTKNADGSTDPFGKLTGIEKYKDGELDIASLFPASPESVASGNATAESAYQSGQVSVATGDYDAIESDDTGTEFMADISKYAPFGITFVKSGNFGNLYWNGELVDVLIDYASDGSYTTISSTKEGGVKLQTVYDEKGELSGVEELLPEALAAAEQARQYLRNESVAEFARTKEQLAPYLAFGLDCQMDFDTGALTMTWKGKPVRRFYDAKSGLFVSNSLGNGGLDEGAVNLEAVYDSSGKLTGVKVV